jgi:uncharacterized membrane protein
MSLADEVRTVRERVAARLKELEPLVREYNELVKLAGELGIDAPERKRSRSTVAVVSADAGETAAAKLASDASRATAARRGGREAGSSGRSRPARQRRQRTSEEAETGPERDARVVEALRAKPGSTIADLASMLGVPPTSLYRPVRELTTSGVVVKRGRGLFVEG